MAVIKLDNEVPNEPVTLNQNCNTPVDGDDLVTYGFGRTSDGGSTSPVLKRLETKYECTGSTCAYMLVFADNDEGICQGDSGGPVLSRSDEQMGVASFVQGGCAQGKLLSECRASMLLNTW